MVNCTILFVFCAAVVFCTGNTVKPKWKFFYSTLNCTQVISDLLISMSQTSVELVQQIFKQRLNSHFKVARICLQCKCSVFF